VIFAFVLGIVPIILWIERKLLGRFQSRIGPNRVGFRGLLQPAADVLKLLSKEDSTPETAVPWMMAIAPVISIVTAVATLAIIPWGPVGAWGGNVGLYGIDVSIGVLYFFAFGSLAFYGLMLGGWASGSKYSFLGAMRSAAQLISYEVALGLSLLGIVMTAGTLSLTEIVEHQDTVWFIVPQFVGFLIFLVAGFAETARAPFDLPEADAEIVAGYNTFAVGYRARGLVEGYRRGLSYVAQLAQRLGPMTAGLRMLAAVVAALVVATILVPPGGATPGQVLLGALGIALGVLFFGAARLRPGEWGIALVLSVLAWATTFPGLGR